MATAQRDVFDAVAEIYDRARPTYPERLFDDVLESARLGPDERVLEIGAGPGKATLGFARRGCTLLCLEPGERLAERLRENCRDHARVEVACVRFEDWKLEPSAFGLVFAAQSLHWVDPDQALPRITRALRPGGTVAVFGNRPLRGDSELHRAVERCYVAHASAFQPGALASYGRRRYDREIAASGAFGTAFRADYPFHREYDADAYLDLLRTQSDHRMMEERARERLLDDIRTTIGAHGGRMRVDYRTELVLARRQSAGSPERHVEV